MTATRRDTLRGIAVLAVADKVFDGGYAEVSLAEKVQRETMILPPGAESEWDFRRRCVRCGLCAKVCPEGIIRMSSRLRVMGLPELDFKNGYCLAGCTKCVEVCPAKALRGVNRGNKLTMKIGTARIATAICLRKTSGENCNACSRKCPVQAVSIEQGLPKVDERRCIGCGTCEHVCPARPKAAITVEGVKEQVKVEMAMNEELRKQMKALVDGGKALVIARGGTIVKAVEGRGIAPLVNLYHDGRDELKGAMIYDKIVGKAAAVIYVRAGAKTVAASVMARVAKEMLDREGIEAKAELVVENIINRDQSGICPMEAAVKDAVDYDIMLANIEKTLERMGQK